MARRMRARLQKFLPLVLLALAMQVLAPIAACLAAGQAVADPLSAGVICHSASEQGGLDDQSHAQAGDLLQDQAEVLLGGEQLVDLGADPLGSR